LRYVVEHSPVDLDKLSPEGKKLIQDTRHIITTARLIVEKNDADELFQNFVWHTDSLKLGALTEKPRAETQKTDGEEGTHSLTLYLHWLLTNYSSLSW
jgi:hypothetical protein